MDLEEATDLLSDLVLEDHPSSINLKYSTGDHRYDMLYNKDKDLVTLFRDGQLAQNMDEFEKIAYKEALDICIRYHHNRDGEPIH